MKIIFIILFLVTIATAEDKVYTDRDLNKYQSNSSSESEESHTDKVLRKADELLSKDECEYIIESMKTCNDDETLSLSAVVSCIHHFREEYEECKHPSIKVRIVK